MEKRDLLLKKINTFQVKIDADTPQQLDEPHPETDFFKYIKSALNEVSTSTNGRKFTIRGNETEVISITRKLVKGEDTTDISAIASRLLREEQKIQKKISHLGTEVHEGLLVQAHIIDKGINKYIICKAENLDFIESKNYKLRNGYPLKRKIFRSVQIIFDSELEIVDIIVNDVNSKGATYWWDSFLEINQLWDDAHNTKVAFEMIDTKILIPIKKSSPSDHMYLRNSTIRYFRTNKEFQLDKYIKDCIEGYQPVDEKLDIESIKDKIKKLPETHGFDERFDLKPSEITAKIKNTIALNDNIDLIIKRDIEIERIITPEMINHRKYIKIRTDEGYDSFVKLKKGTK